VGNRLTAVERSGAYSYSFPGPIVATGLVSRYPGPDHRCESWVVLICHDSTASRLPNLTTHPPGGSLVFLKKRIVEPYPSDRVLCLRIFPFRRASLSQRVHPSPPGRFSVVRCSGFSYPLESRRTHDEPCLISPWSEWSHKTTPPLTGCHPRTDWPSRSANVREACLPADDSTIPVVVATAAAAHLRRRSSVTARHRLRSTSRSTGTTVESRPRSRAHRRSKIIACIHDRCGMVVNIVPASLRVTPSPVCQGEAITAPVAPAPAGGEAPRMAPPAACLVKDAGCPLGVARVFGRMVPTRLRSSTTTTYRPRWKSPWVREVCGQPFDVADLEMEPPAFACQ